MLSGGTRATKVVARVLPAAAMLAASIAVAPVFAGTASAKGKVKPKVKHGTLTVTATSAADTIVLRLRASHPTQVEVVATTAGSTHSAFFDRSTFDHILVEAGSGDDQVSIDESNGVFTDTEVTTIDGGGDNDALLGGSGAETFLGGDGDDFVAGSRGSDTAFLGAGDDTFQGNGSDIVEGQEGRDSMAFDGGGLPETFDISANGGRVRFFRDAGNVTVDLDNVERIQVNAPGGTDSVTVNDVSGTDLTEVDIDLAGSVGGTAGNGVADHVIVNGTGGDDVVFVLGGSSGVDVSGIAALVRITHSEATDTLRFNALAGDDFVNAMALGAAAIALTEDGGDGNDVLVGSDGDDTILGGNGDDVLIGGPGVDTLDGGPGDNIILQD